jgi:two-component system, cell cycle response regulator
MLKVPTRFDELKATGRLPSPTGVALEVLRVTRQPNSTAAELARIVQADPALTGRLLCLANSSYHALSRPAANIAEAVLRLGMRTVSAVCLSFSIVGANRRGCCRAFDYDKFWQASLARACALGNLADCRKTVSRHDAFTLGLLSHVGELALATLYSQEYDILLTAQRGLLERDRLWSAELDAFGISSRDLSTAMLRDWGLPESFVEAVLAAPPDVSSPNAARTQTLTALLASADEIAVRYMRSFEQSLTETDTFKDVLSRLEISDHSVWHQTFLQELSQWRTLLSLPEPSNDRSRCAPPSARGLLREEEPAHVPPLSVLVADDDSLQLELMCKLLKQVGCEVRAACNGREALELAVTQRPDVVVADWQMPQLNGLDLCRTLRQSAYAQSVYLMLVTAADDEAVLLEAYESGVDDFVTKPLRPRAFQARMKAARRFLRLEAKYQAEQAEFRRLTGELAIANRKLEDSMLTDFLTGLPNRRYLISRLEQEWAAARRSQTDLALLMLDVDHFKRINDEYGHDIGDAVLQQFAGLLRAGIRAQDTACRCGGKEFVIILPRASAHDAETLAERLRNTIQTQLSGMVPVLSRPVTVSIGVAVDTEAVASISALLKQADEALYSAKHQGRNRVVRLSGRPSDMADCNAISQAAMAVSE